MLCSAAVESGYRKKGRRLAAAVMPGRKITGLSMVRSNGVECYRLMATIDQQLCSDRKRCLIRSEKHDSIRDLSRLSEPSNRNLPNEVSLCLFITGASYNRQARVFRKDRIRSRSLPEIELCSTIRLHKPHAPAFAAQANPISLGARSILTLVYKGHVKLPVNRRARVWRFVWLLLVRTALTAP